ncbi:MAG: restriction endonuclease subunit S [Melioribacteraceae bacterium]|nr:restriction endonuclease subunit S [Melioribacteraceae bacterium]
MPGLNRNDAYAIEIPLPPLTEQHRIVEKIEELFSELDNGIENLKKSKEQIKTYRQAVLKFAFEGKLTQVQRTKDKGKSENGELPEGWEWVKLGDAAKVKGGKRLPKGEAYSEIKTEYPYLRVVDFDNMTIRKENLKYLKKETREKIERYTISKNDLYISIAGTIGRVGLIPDRTRRSKLNRKCRKNN